MNNFECLWERIDNWVAVDDPYDCHVPLSREQEKLYFVQQGTRGPVKIGISKEPEERIKVLQTGNPKKLRLIWTINPKSKNVENTLHRVFLDERLEGEWFLPSEMLARLILETIEHSFDGCWFESNELIFNRNDISGVIT
uniref:Bacteriophage T5 Orf172 DNA-binding domain-containing protein n=1 Tax=viral metagenome TaxID=1070528 RepID=A0A6H1ZYZ5_9ZZZZ